MDYLAPLPVAVPFAASALLMAASPLLSRPVHDGLALATTAFVAVVCGLLLAHTLGGVGVVWFGGWTPRDGVAIGICFAVDPFGAGLALFTTVLVLAALVFSCRYFTEIDSLYPALMLIFLGAMAGFCLTGDLFNLFVFFELMSVAAYALTGYKVEEKQALMGAFNFAVANSVGAFLVLMGIGLLYGRTGALNLAQLGRALAGGRADGLAAVALTLIVCGLGVKAAFVPLHFWLADAHAVAPSPVCVLFSGVMVELALYGIARIYWTVFAGAVEPFAPILRGVWLGFAVATIVVGAVMALAERHLKRLLAFSTISHVGMFLAGLALLTPDGLAGAGLYVVGHGLVKGALFLGTGILLNRFGSVDTGELRGAARDFRLLGVTFAVCGLAMGGLPPFGSWLGKSLLEHSAAELGRGWLAPVLLAASALTGGAVLRAAGQVFLGLGPPENQGADTPRLEDKDTDEDYDRPPAVLLGPVFALTVLALGLGLWPGLEEHARHAASRFMDRPGYAAAVLGGSPGSGPPPAAPSGSQLTGILYGLGGAAGAIVIAALALFPHRIPRRLRAGARRLFQPPLEALRSVHSGHVGDYVTWIVVGTAVMGGLFELLLR